MTTRLLILDLETTGLDPSCDRVIELGAILYSVPHRCVLQQLSTLFPVDSNPVERVNRISAEASQQVPELPLGIFTSTLMLWQKDIDYLVAHNANFDKQWFGRGVLPALSKPWLCTYEDFRWPENDKPRNLVQTALNHGIGVSHAHRALTDCQLIAALFDRVENFEVVLQDAIARSQEPFVYAIAHVSYEERQNAKDQRFRWNEYIERKWVKRIRRSELEQEQSLYSFDIEIVEIPKTDRPPEPPPPPPPMSLPPDQMAAVWQEMLRQIQSLATRELLRQQAQLVVLRDTTATLSVPKVLQSLVRSKQAEIERALGAVLGQAIAITLVDPKSVP
ncbi:MAG: exonuclease domain-containing protein [Cyanobacteriota bacterium]|nr:MAG: hypothetical protein EYR95_15220 [Phormidium sp. SL48-SHIP]